MLSHLGAAFELEPLLMLLLGIMIGLPVGAIPGLTATMTIAIALPVTFYFDPLPGVMMLLGIYISAMFAGAIPAILINTPGTPSAAATVLDGHPMMRNGQGGSALSASAIAAGFGGMIGGIMLALVAPVISDVTQTFSSAVYFMLAVLGLMLVVAISERYIIRGLITAALGLIISFVGLDPVGGVPRFTFGSNELLGGMSLVPLLIGLYGFSEAMLSYENIHERTQIGRRFYQFLLTRRQWRQIAPTTLGSSAIGFFVGVLPGVGGDIGGFAAYNGTKRMAKEKSKFGQGDIRGVAAAEAANNATSSGALVPMLTLGIPGDTVTAILIGAITVHGLRPGPQLFESSPELISGIFVSVILGALIVMLLGLAGVHLWAQVIRVRPSLFWPVVLVLCVLGSYSFRANITDVYIMLGAGVAGYFLKRGNFPLAPLVIGLILGPIMEENFGRAISVSGGSYSWLFDPLPFTLLALTALSIVLAALRSARRPNDTSKHSVE